MKVIAINCNRLKTKNLQNSKFHIGPSVIKNYNIPINRIHIRDNDIANFKKIGIIRQHFIFSEPHE